MALYRNRRHAGRELAVKLAHYAGASGLIVLALPRGGVPVGFEVARALHAPLDVYVVRKLGVPDSPELAMGAIAHGGVRVVNREVVESLRIPPRVFEEVAEREAVELARREEAYRRGRPPLALEGRTVLLVDDGLATGSTMLAAIASLATRRAARTVVAVPIGAAETCAAVRRHVDDVVCGATPAPFNAVGLWYEDFSQTTDDEVQRLLAPPPPQEAVPWRSSSSHRS